MDRLIFGHIELLSWEGLTGSFGSTMQEIHSCLIHIPLVIPSPFPEMAKQQQQQQQKQKPNPLGYLVKLVWRNLFPGLDVAISISLGMKGRAMRTKH